MEKIKSYWFDLDDPVYLVCAKRKFWEVQISKSDVSYRAGVLRGNNEEHKIIEISKDYETNSLARATAIIKIKAKLQKGYFSTSAFKEQTEVPRKTRRGKRAQNEEEEQRRRQEYINQLKQDPPKAGNKQIKEAHKTLWKGFEKGQEIIQLKITGNCLRVTRQDSIKDLCETKDFSSYEEAVNFASKQEKRLFGQGFRQLRSQTFLKQEVEKKSKSTERQKSLIQMTDRSMVIGSGVSGEESIKNVYRSNQRLGLSTDHCIKCLLAENFKEGTDPTGWIMSEKLDGVRCLWTGEEMYSRNGNKYHFPQFFTRNWPKSQLDGQLFIGRGKFSQTISAVKKNIPIATEWENLRYLVFDAPGLMQPFRRRIQVLQDEIAKIENPFLVCHPHRPCKSKEDLQAELQQVNKAGGEGIMLRKPEALYEHKRSKSLQKVKTFHDDEAEVIEHKAGTGRLSGMVGALRVRNTKGVEFDVGSGMNDQLRQNPPPVGSTITYRYQEFIKETGKPRFPTYVRMHESV